MSEPIHAGTAADQPRPRGGDGRPTVALALGGGGARGLAHIHVIEALDDWGIRPVAVAGTSIGSIMGAALCAGMSGAFMREHATSAFMNKSEMAARLWRLRPAALGGLARSGFRVGQLDVARVMEAFLPAFPERFEELTIPLTVTATDYYGHKELRFASGDLASALAASAAIPGVFRPVRRDGRVLIDGGICNPCPFDILEGVADIVIAVDVVGAPVGDETREPPMMDCIIGANQLTMRTITEAKRRISPPQIMLHSRHVPIRALDFHRAGDILEWSSHLREDLHAALAMHGLKAAA